MEDAQLLRTIDLELPIDAMNRVRAISDKLNIAVPTIIEHLLAICFEGNAEGDLLQNIRTLAAELQSAERSGFQ